MSNMGHAPKLRYFQAAIDPVGELQCDVTISTGDIARDGDAWEPTGAQLDNYRANPIVLFNHNPATPVGTAGNIRVAGNTVVARVTFATPGVSSVADMVRGLVKDGTLSGISAGALPIEMEPIDPNRPRGGQRWLRWELFETSFVAVPGDVGATVTARSAFHRGGRWAGTGRDARRLAVRALAAGVPFSREERMQSVADLLPGRPRYVGDDATFASEMAEHLVQRTLLIGARAYREADLSRAERLLRAAELAECP